jgi:hypothetical protein
MRDPAPLVETMMEKIVSGRDAQENHSNVRTGRVRAPLLETTTSVVRR